MPGLPNRQMPISATEWIVLACGGMPVGRNLKSANTSHRTSIASEAIRSRSSAIAALGEESKGDYLLTNPTIRNAKAIVRSTTRQR
jgi:hypothetical protein